MAARTDGATMLHIEDVGLAVAGQRLLDRLDAEVGLQRDRHPPGQHAAGEAVQHGGEVE